MSLLHHHVGVSVSDLDESRKWYADVLGMTEGHRFEIPPFGLRGCFMAGHGTRVELLERAGSAGGIGGHHPPEALLTRGYGHIAFETSDLDADYAGLVARGALPVWDPRPSPEAGIRMAFVADNDGNLVELVEAGAAQFAEDVNTGR